MKETRFLFPFGEPNTVTVAKMTPRRRVLAALSHQPTDVVPFDIGGTQVTSLNVRAYARLMRHLSRAGEPRLRARARGQGDVRRDTPGRHYRRSDIRVPNH